ncbi:hypothetical protein JG688_00000837 [Phytophthora aleatoria]|uniref:Photolyase/cryptochrome alpha/beta domain-containing protein n=1 Tax=Phytophthora aleatoria TaxID=2496075 RepID=A0A8J5IWK5_9STRA|nr:hypothetical protein JG688_00000837 [Phytophthora aleatoria]
MTDRSPPPSASLLPSEDAADDADLVDFASSLLDAADADSELPESTLDAATLDAVHAAINAPHELASESILTPNLPVILQQQQSVVAEEKNEPIPSEISPATGSGAGSDDEIRILMWFRRDLRLHDNLALTAALEWIKQQQEMTAGRKVVFIPLYIVHRPKIMRCGVNRFQFMLESVSDLADALAARGSRLVVARGDGVQVLRHLLPAWRISHLFFDAASEPFAIDRDNRAVALARRLGVETHVTHGYTLYDLDAVIAGNNGEPPKTYTAFLRALAMQPKPPKPLPTPEKVPAPVYLPSELYQQVVDYWRNRLKPDTNVKEEKTEDEEEGEEDDDPQEKAKQLDEIAGPEQQFTLPEVSDFGYEAPERHPFIYGGEQIALGILRDYCRNEGRVVKFEKPKTSPAQTTPSASTTSLSPYLYFGSISPRTFLHHVRGIQEHHAKALSATPVSLDGQLLWREFFHCHGRANPYFDKMEESTTCLQIDWRWHTIPEKEEDMTDDDKLARSQFKAWIDGQTGFPWIDAIMIQLKEEGWMHHLARHSVACFLTRGDLYISWVRGLEVFQERLIDHDWSINAGNWLWLSSSYFFSAYFRVYSPSTFGKKWDPEGLFIRKYVPVLSKMPVKYIYEPWKAPMTVQHAAGCLIGKDYPFPIVDHKIAMRRSMADHESNDDDDDSGDDNNDDDDGDDKDNKDSDDESESSSQSSSGQEAAAIQSSVVTNLDGVNIGNTITIINIGGGLANSSGSGGSGSNGQPSNGFAVSDTDRSAITSAAVRAFCGSIGCNLSNVKDFLIFPMVASHTKTKKTRAKKRKQRASSRGKKRSPSWKKPALTSLLDLSPVDRSMLALGLKSKTLHDQAKVLAKGLKETKLKLAKVKQQNGELAATDRERLKLDKQLEKQLEVATVSGGHVMEEYKHLHMLMPMRMGCNVDTANWFRR